MRWTITISVTDEMHSQIHEGMRSRYYSTVSEYIRFLVRRDRIPAAIRQNAEEFAMPKTANEVMEEAIRESRADGEYAGYQKDSFDL